MKAFDVISYARDNEVAVEVMPLSPSEGIRLRLRDIFTAAQESATIRPGDLSGQDPEMQAAYIESRCDELLASIGKRKHEHSRRAAEQAHRNAIEDFFRGH